MNVIITGASRGIGQELARVFGADEQNNVLLIARDATRLELIRSECGSDVISVLPGDISSSDFTARLSAWVDSHWGSVDILINNAGYLVNKPFEQMTPEDFDKSISINYKAPYFITQAIFPYLKKGNVKHVVNIGSMGGVQSASKFPGLSIYSSSKMALAGLTECLATEFSESGISVNCLALGSVQTKMLEEAFPGYTAESQPEEMAAFIYNWAVEAGVMVSGKIIPVGKVAV